MKRVLLIIFISAGLDISAQNLVNNPGFESWDAPDQPTGWTKIRNCFIESAVIHSGNNSCFHSGSTTDRSDLYQIIPVTSGKQYSLSLFYKTGPQSTGSGSRIWCSWSDAQGALFNDIATKDLMQPTRYLSNPEWSQFSITVTAPPLATGFRLEVRTYKNSSIFWDDFVFEQTIPTAVRKDEESELKIFPNPAVDYLKISGIDMVERIDITDLSGTILFTTRAKYQNEIIVPVYNYKQGIYLVKIISGDRIRIERFIKMY
jgi:hypothetical protein